MCAKPFLFATVVLIFCAHAIAADAGDDWVSGDGLFVVSFETELDPIGINRIHNWVLSIRTANDEPVQSAELTVVGGMPLHNHGLPTRPRVTENLGDGRYRLEGMRFHMNGQWEVSVTITADGNSDTVIIVLDL